VPPPGSKDIQAIIMNEDKRPGDEEGTVVVEQVVFEMTFSTNQWRRLRRKKVVRQ
jgi:hypothetical protein